MSVSPTVLLVWAVTIVVVSIVLLVGMDVASEFAEGINANQSEFERAANETVSPDGPSLMPIPVVVILSLLVGSVISIVSRSDQSDSTQSDSPDKITLIKQRYMDDEIKTTVKLEKELEDHVEPYLDDSDVQEIDDLLHGDDSDE